MTPVFLEDLQIGQSAEMVRTVKAEDLTAFAEVTGDKNAGTVWGTDLYTDDSALAAVAVHAGLVADGQKGVVKVTIAPGADAYQGSDRNGVASIDYAEWGGSYRIEAVKK